MSDITVNKLNGGKAQIKADDLAALRSALRGEIALPGDDGFDRARTIWNAMIDRKPAAVIRCQGTSDVMEAVRFASKHGLLVAVRGGGHNIAGKAICDGGILIDLSPMRSVHVDRETRTAWVEPGATLADFDRECLAFSLATPVGINSTTGIAGLTLGGGFGWITRKYGLTIDNLLAVDIVMANGEMLRASETQNADLFWALRGGGGNFGIVTGFKFQLHDFAPQILSGLIVHPFDAAPTLIDEYRKFVRNAPKELSVWVVMRQAPPLPFLPKEWHGKLVFIMAACYAGDMAEGEKILAPLRHIGSPIADVISPHAFTGWQAAFDPLLTPGARNYWKTHDFAALSNETCTKLLDFAQRLPSPECEIFIASLGGRMGEISNDATAYGGRGANFVLNVHARWQNAADDQRCIGWARDFFKATEPQAMGTAYINFLTDEEGDRLTSAYGSNFGRLAAIKAKYDPRNLFRMNQNIRPDTQARAAE
ncbi:MAG: FAD-binding oxidoreductase [Phyllobacterium sp.]